MKQSLPSVLNCISLIYPVVPIDSGVATVRGDIRPGFGLLLALLWSALHQSFRAIWKWPRAGFLPEV